MEVFDGRYYKSCKGFLRGIGLWPYQNQTTRIKSSIIFYAINLSLAIPQVGSIRIAILLIKQWGNNFNIMVENSISLMFATVCMLKYFVTYISASRLNLLFLQVVKDWQTLIDDQERKILIKHNEEGRLLVILYTVYLLFAWFVYTMMPFAPFFLDLVSPLPNGSRSILLPFYADYVIFRQVDYHYWCCCHIAIVYFTSWFLYAGIDGTFVLTVKHTCGLFAITCLRIENMGKTQKDDEFSIEKKKDSIVCNEMKKAITLHNESIRCFDLLEDSFNACFLIVNCLSVLGLALALVYVRLLLNDLFKFIRVIAFLAGIIMHLLYLNWVGQKIIDGSEQVFLSAYFSNWYIISANARKFTAISMVRSLKPCELTAGKIATLSMESFGILLKTTMSYFTVFLSVT